uniref:Uncharacterized protein n=1 Tax=Rhizochromulina marina TaxID=1034831 RepID=A0A7S2SCV1_9STRA|mmetsp:Transcript_28401/g.83008  ORF Transcript_28401/g.83008 Transcript_28401/m.83008 type:complete len:103 (+) Transcript_28401:57-365(+)
MAAKGGPIDFSALQAGAKNLKETTVAPRKAEGKGGDELDDKTIASLVSLYDKYNGSLDDIFDELGENPSKAKKYPPRDAEDFAQRYYAGAFTYVDPARAQAK